jgi:hypothetical protein
MLKSPIRQLVAACCAVVIVVTAGCIELDLCFPVSEHPLSDATTALDDDQLVGKWREGETSKESLQIEKVPDRRGEYTISGFADAATKQTLICTQIGDKKYASIEFKKNGDEPLAGMKGYFLVRYDFTHDSQLRLYFPECKVLATALAAEKIAGKVEFSEVNPKSPTTIELTASIDDLRKFVEANADQLYPPGEEVTMLNRAKQ